jgi:ribonuclease P protein component
MKTRNAAESVERLPRPVAQGAAGADEDVLPVSTAVDGSAEAPAPSVRAGFVVSKAVGNSVVRHRVARRLRHLVAARLGTLPAGATLVVRALPPAATASSAELGADLDGALKRLSLLAKSDEGPAE